MPTERPILLQSTGFVHLLRGNGNILGRREGHQTFKTVRTVSHHVGIGVVAAAAHFGICRQVQQAEYGLVATKYK